MSRCWTAGRKHVGAVTAIMLAILPAARAKSALAPTEGVNCPTLSWTTLGTAGGPVPTRERSEPANLLTVANQQILVDTGDGTVDQLAKVGIDLGAVRTVFISHHHMDHTGGLAAVIGLRWMNQFPGELTVYGPPGTRHIVDGIIETMRPQSRIGFGLGKAPPSPESAVHVIEISQGSVVSLPAGVTVTAVTNSHFSHPGSLEPDEPQSLSYRFEVGGRAITFTGDTGPSTAVARLASNSDLLVSEVIDLESLVAEIVKRRKDASAEMLADIRTHLSSHHLSPQDVARIASSAHVTEVVLTHFAIPPGPVPAEALIKAVHGEFGGLVAVSHDLQSFTVKCR